MESVFVSQGDEAPRVHPVLHLLAPVVAASAVWAARLAINQSYRRVSGRTPPVPSDPGTSWARAIAWTAVTATTAAVIEVTIHRVANQRFPLRWRTYADATQAFAPTASAD